MIENLSVKGARFQRGNITFFALVAIVIVALGGLAYFTGIFGSSETDAEIVQAQAQPAQESLQDSQQAETAADVQPAAASDGQDKQDNSATAPVSAGNPVVAKIGDKNVTRAEVLGFIQTLSPQARQMPVDKLFPMALEQMVNAELINQKLKGVNLDNDPLVKQEMQTAKQQIIRSVFMQKEADKALTDEVLQKAYDEYKKNFPNLDEVKARHILVKEEGVAKDIIKKIQQGEDFAALAKEFSIDATKAKGGELNYFVKQEVVPEFGNAVFAMKIKEVSKSPVKSSFGYHVIEVLDIRKRQPPSFEQAKPFIEAQLRGQALNAVVSRWRSEANVELFDINGKPIKPAAQKEQDKDKEG